MHLPLRTFSSWLKQISPSTLTEIQTLALNVAFPGFLPLSEPTEKMMADLESGRAGFWQSQPSRRFSGDDSLPTGRYYTLANDAEGDDRGTLVNELMAYGSFKNRPVLFYDLEGQDKERLPYPRVPHHRGIVICFVSREDYLNPFIMAAIYLGIEKQILNTSFKDRLPSGEEAYLHVVYIPYDVKLVSIDNIIDLRYPDCQKWFVEMFGTSELERFFHEGYGNTNYRNFEHFHEMLPALLWPESGGGMFTGISSKAGIWMRQNSVNALIYPSARSDCALTLKGEQPVDFTGWNLVDYRGAPPPFIAIAINITLGGWPSTLSGEARVILNPDAEYKGSWKVEGLRGWHLQRFIEG